MIFSLFAALAFAPFAPTESYDCVLDAPVAASTAEGGQSSKIGLPESMLRFTMAIDRSPGGISARIDWPENPFQIAGSFKGIPTGPGATAFLALSGGPCMFTEQACMAVIHFVEQADKTAKVIISPVALTRDSKTNVRTPFAVVAAGRCTRQGTAK